MQTFLPYKEVFKTAKCLDPRRLNKQIIECKQIFDAIDGTGKGWFNHPIVKMYKGQSAFVQLYMTVLQLYATDERGKSKEIGDTMAELEAGPSFITNDYCDQMKRRLYTKDPIYYAQFAEFGTSNVNWYYVDGEWVYYKNRKQININE